MNTNFQNQNVKENGKPKEFNNSDGTLPDPRAEARIHTILERDRNQCVNCSASENLIIHIRQYHYSKALKAFKDPWQYANKYLVTLCEKCHRIGHDQYQVPVKYIN